MVSKQKTIHNFNLRFFCILLAIVMLSLIGLSYTGITVYADTGTSVEAEHSDGSYTSSGGNGMPLIADQVGTKDKVFSFIFLNVMVVAQSPAPPRRHMPAEVEWKVMNFMRRINTIVIQKLHTGSLVIHIGQQVVQYQTMVVS